MREKTTSKMIERYISNLNEEGLRQIAYALLINPENRKFILCCVEEFDKAFRID